MVETPKKWPGHKLKSVEELYALAASHGWDFVKETNHNTVRVFCSENECDFRIFSTGKSTEAKINQFRRKIVRCAHNKIANEALANIEGKLANIDRLVTAAELRVELDSANALFDTSDSESELTELFLQIEDLEMALSGFAELGETSDLMDSADEKASEVRSLINKLNSETSQLADFRDRLRILKQRIIIVKSRL